MRNTRICQLVILHIYIFFFFYLFKRKKIEPSVQIENSKIRNSNVKKKKSFDAFFSKNHIFQQFLLFKEFLFLYIQADHYTILACKLVFRCKMVKNYFDGQSQSFEKYMVSTCVSQDLVDLNFFFFPFLFYFSARFYIYFFLFFFVCIIFLQIQNTRVLLYFVFIFLLFLLKGRE